MVASQYYLVLVLGLVFLLAGAGTLAALSIFFMRQRRNSPATPNRTPIPTPAIFLVITGCLGAVGALVLLFLFLGPSLPARRRLVHGALHSPAASITEITIGPPPGTGVTPLTTAPVVIIDREQIDRLATCLDQATDASPNHPDEAWSASLTVTTATGRYPCIVRFTGNTEDGTLIYFWSGDGSGWAIGTFRTDGLGEAIQQIISGQQPPTTTPAVLPER